MRTGGSTSGRLDRVERNVGAVLIESDAAPPLASRSVEDDRLLACSQTKSASRVVGGLGRQDDFRLLGESLVERFGLDFNVKAWCGP